MSNIAAFRALLPPVDKVAQIASVPYDVVNRAEAKALAHNNPLSFLRVSRPEIEMDDNVDPYSPEVYAKGAENFQRLIQEAPLLQDDEAAIYVYSLVMNGNRQTGIVAAVSIDDYDNEIVKKHEKTRQQKEDDRTNQITALKSQTGPVFLTHRPNTEVRNMISTKMQEEKLYSIVAEDGISHEIWRFNTAESAKISELFQNIESLYIADGHHRAASASRVREKFRQENPNHTGHENYNRFLNVIFAGDELKILPYNRFVHDLNGKSKEEFCNLLKQFNLTETHEKSPSSGKNINMYLNGKWYTLQANTASTVTGAASLDVAFLQDKILSPILGIDDPRTNNRIDFVGGIRGTAELEKLVDNKENSVAFSMFPTTVDELMEVSDAGEMMPPKSTWFEPKLRDGLFCHNI